MQRPPASFPAARPTRRAAAVALAILTFAATAHGPPPSRALPGSPATRLDDGESQALDERRGLSLVSSRPLPVRDLLLVLFRGTRFSVVEDVRRRLGELTSRA